MLFFGTAAQPRAPADTSAICRGYRLARIGAKSAQPVTKQQFLVVLGALASGSLAAHEVPAGVSPFMAHALHLFREPDHLALAAAAGVLIGQGRPFERGEGVLAFGMALFLGMFTPQFLSPLPVFSGVENLLVAACLLVIGLLVLTFARLGKWPLAAIGAAAGTVHGLASGLAVPAGTFWYPAFLGAILGSLAVTSAGMWLGDAARRGPTPLVARALGLLIIALAAMRLAGPLLR